jgi:hypothetical protein
MDKKEQCRIKLLEYLGDPENEPLSRAGLASRVLGLRNRTGLYRVFTVQELSDIESEALKVRRERCARHSFSVDRALLKKATAGDVKAAELYYKRIEGWNEKQVVSIAPSLDEIRALAVAQGYDPDEFVAVYLGVKSKGRGIVE